MGAENLCFRVELTKPVLRTDPKMMMRIFRNCTNMIVCQFGTVGAFLLENAKN